MVVMGMALLLAASPARALFHFAHISEINVAGGGNLAIQYVEIEMEAILQNRVTNSLLGTWDCNGAYLGDQYIVPSDVPNAGNGVKWIMGTQRPLGLLPLVVDFEMPGASLETDCGQVCWGAPQFQGIPVDPGTWDHTDPNQYVDCVAYGNYAGLTATGSGSPTSLPPGDGTLSLTRIADTGDNATDSRFGVRRRRTTRVRPTTSAPASTRRRRAPRP
jgi:hypothetical protein